MTSDSGRGPAEPMQLSRKRVRFFNVSLRNGMVVSTPSYTEKQAFCAHLIRSLEESNPDFAWIQFLFIQSNYSSALIRLKNSMHRTKTAIEQPAIDLISGQERERREIHRDYYRKLDASMKKVDDISTKPTITLAIQGMWVSGESQSSVLSLPFDHCYDEHDSLATFQYRDPRMLLELVDRRMVSDVSEYLDRYTRSRLEPPSFIVTPEELQSYIHLPAGETAGSLRSLEVGTSTRGFTQGRIVGEETNSGKDGEISSKIVKVASVPKMEAMLEDSSTQPLTHLATPTVRTLEFVYSDERTEVLLSAETVEDMRNYAGLLTSVYGGMKFEKREPAPYFLRELSAILR
jgi:hypothetical protein